MLQHETLTLGVIEDIKGVSYDDASLKVLLENLKQIAKVALSSVDKQGKEYIFSYEKHSA